VYDAISSAPAVGALITTIPPSASVTTDADGHYTIDNVTPGQYTVLASKAGYGSGSTAVTAQSGGSVVADIALTKGSGNAPPAMPFNPHPDSSATVNPAEVMLSWSASDPERDPMKYDVYFGTTNPPTARVATNITDTVFRAGATEPGKTYYWSIVARDDHGGATIGPVWWFKTRNLSGPGSSLVFNGTGAYGLVGDAPDLRLSGGSYSIEAWVKPTAVDEQWRMVLSKGNSNDDLEYLLGLDRSNKFLFVTRRPPEFIYSKLIPAPNQWYHLAVVQDIVSSTILVYINGQLDQTLPISGQPSLNSARIFIGARDNFGSGTPISFFAGELDELRIWNRARTAQEIADGMVYASSGTEPGLVAYWSFDEGSGQTVLDRTGHGHTMQLFEGVSWRASTAPIQ
jgi:hypothetical protein